MKYLILSILICHNLFGTSYSQPRKKEVFSFNKKYKILVNPGTGTHKIFEVSKPQRPIWSFNKGVWQLPFIISNDGKTVVTTAWRHTQDDSEKGYPITDKDAITFWRNGVKWKVIKFKSIFPNPPKTQDVGIGPLGDIWRTWYYDIAIHANNFSIKLTNNKIVTVSLTDAKIIPSPKNIFPKDKKHQIVENYVPYLDTDKDGILDYLEARYKLNPKVHDSHLDQDGDGFRNIDEIKYETLLDDPEEFPPIFFRFRVKKFEEAHVILINELDNKSYHLKTDSNFTVKDINGDLYKFKLVSIHKKYIIIDDEIEGQVRITSKPILPSPKTNK